MPLLNFPFWLVRADHVELPPAFQPCGGNYWLTFSSPEKAIAYMEARGSGKWQLTLVSRPTLKDLLRELQQAGVNGVCHDARPDGSNGTVIPLNDLLSRNSA